MEYFVIFGSYVNFPWIPHLKILVKQPSHPLLHGWSVGADIRANNGCPLSTRTELPVLGLLSRPSSPQAASSSSTLPARRQPGTLASPQAPWPLVTLASTWASSCHHSTQRDHCMQVAFDWFNCLRSLVCQRYTINWFGDEGRTFTEATFK